MTLPTSAMGNPATEQGEKAEDKTTRKAKKRGNCKGCWSCDIRCALMLQSPCSGCEEQLDVPSAEAGVRGMYSVDVWLVKDTLAPVRSILVLRQVLEQTFVCW